MKNSTQFEKGPRGQPARPIGFYFIIIFTTSLFFYRLFSLGAFLQLHDFWIDVILIPVCWNQRSWTHSFLSDHWRYETSSVVRTWIESLSGFESIRGHRGKPRSAGYPRPHLGWVSWSWVVGLFSQRKVDKISVAIRQCNWHVCLFLLNYLKCIFSVLCIQLTCVNNLRVENKVKESDATLHPYI